MRAAVITAHGDPDCVRLEEVAEPTVAADEVLVRLEAAGLNFHDIIERRSGYPGQPNPPIPTGLEGAGTVQAVGGGVSGFAVGDRVVWSAVPASHAELVAVPARDAIPVPGGVSASLAAAVCAQGLTAHYLATSLRTAAAGDRALVWGAAGGVGRLLTQMLSTAGVRVLAAVSTAEKAAIARTAGAEDVVLNSGVAAAVARLTDERGMDVVYDGVGAPTFDVSLASVRSRGLLVVYGRAGGQVPPVDLFRLSSAGSVQLVRPRLVDFVASRTELLERAQDVFAWLAAGRISALIGAAIPLSEIAEAHALLESRAVCGKVVLVP